jgi:CheY-like chemotaxis protein
LKILVVEDDPDLVDAITRAAMEADDRCEIVVASCRDAAIGALQSDPPDLVVCDLTIPSTESMAIPDVAHGLMVCEHIKSVHPGIPLLVLSASAEVAAWNTVNRDPGTANWLGDGRKALVEAYQKVDLLAFLERLKAVVAQWRLIDLVEIEGPPGFPQDARDARVARIFAHNVGGSQVVCLPIGGGLSDVLTCSLEARDSRGRTVAQVFGRIGSLAELTDEHDRYDRYVAHMLGAGVYAPFSDEVTAGARDHGGLFYALAAGATSLGDVVRTDADKAVHMVSQLEEATAVWRQGAGQNPDTVAGVRRLAISDDDYAPLREKFGNSAWDDFDRRPVQVTPSSAHGDLHCYNVLVTLDQRVILIDYGRTGPSTAAFDPVSLELSFYYHRDAAAIRDDWLKSLNPTLWADEEGYCVGAAGQIVAACRRWARGAAAGRREILACAFAVSARALRYPDVDKELACAVIEAAIAGDR